MAAPSKEEQAVATAPLSDSEQGESDVYIDPELEKRTLRKFDKWVLPQFMLLVLIAYLDRSNIGESNIYRKEISSIADNL